MLPGSRSAFVLVFFLLIPVCIPAQTEPPDSVGEMPDASDRNQSVVKAFTEPVRLEHNGKLYSLARNWAFLPADNPRAATAPLDQLPFRSMQVPSQ
ncbi:MAG: hypothetical protein KDK30_14950 [Leptospiraceae bacterium]|nr:hypothetical protein [Leptospiraceae bacterium]